MPTTLASSVACTGVGLHSGAEVKLTLVPEGEGDRGRYFVRTDLQDAVIIPAQVSQVGETVLSTELVSAAGAEQGTVRTVEHLLAALVSHGVEAVHIEVDGPELPLLDGSAQGWRSPPPASPQYPRHLSIVQSLASPTGFTTAMHLWRLCRPRRCALATASNLKRLPSASNGTVGHPWILGQTAMTFYTLSVKLELLD